MSSFFTFHELNASTVRRLARADMVLGISAGVPLLVGLLRVFCFEKRAAYYFHSATFIAKLGRAPIARPCPRSAASCISSWSGWCSSCSSPR